MLTIILSEIHHQVNETSIEFWLMLNHFWRTHNPDPCQNGWVYEVCAFHFSISNSGFEFSFHLLSTKRAKVNILLQESIFLSKTGTVMK